MEEEMLDVVGENDKVVRKAARKEVRENVLLHRTSRVVVFNRLGELFVQKRSKNKKTFASHWDIGIAETVKSGEDYEKAALRGLNEEAGINQKNISFLFKIRYKSSKTNEQCSVYELNYDGNFILQKEELEKIDFLSLAEIKNFIKKEKFHPVGKIVFEKYLEYNSLKKCYTTNQKKSWY